MLVQSGPKMKGLAMKVRENRSQLRPVVDLSQRIMCLSHIIIQSGAERDLPQRKGPDRGAERDLNRRKGPDLIADPPGENVLVCSCLGLGIARIAIPFHSGASSSARGRAHHDREVTPEWARFLVQAQQASDERLFMLESEVKRSSEEYNVISSKHKHKFNKKIYGDQYEFNVKISAILRKALSSRDELDKQMHINEHIELINKRNRLLVLVDAHGWEVAEAYNADPLADDSADKKKIRKAKKEGKILRDQKFKNARMLSKKQSTEETVAELSKI